VQASAIIIFGIKSGSVVVEFAVNPEADGTKPNFQKLAAGVNIAGKKTTAAVTLLSKQSSPAAPSPPTSTLQLADGVSMRWLISADKKLATIGELLHWPMPVCHGMQVGAWF
jgi:hypothetical protein